MNIKLSMILLGLLMVNPAFANKWFVNVNTGDDTYDGTSDVFVAGLIGPKKTIGNAVTFALDNDTIYIAEGVYEEKVLLTKSLVIRGNNWGINPLTQVRKPETILVPPLVSIGIPVSGNSLIEILACCIEIDGLNIKGDNTNTITGPTKYGKEYEISYGVAGKGNYNNINITNLIISNFAISGINLASDVFSTQANKISNCKIKTGEQNSTAILLSENFYSDISIVTIDSVGSGIVLNNFFDKNSKPFTISYLNITAETNGITLDNFTGNTDNLIFDFNIMNPLDPNIAFSGMVLNDMSSTGNVGITNTTINKAKTGITLKNIFDNFNLNISDNKISGGGTGIYIEQSLIAPAINLAIRKTELTGLDSAGISVLADGDTTTLTLTDTKISMTPYGLVLKGNSTADPGNTAFDLISKYYIFLDTSLTGTKPVLPINATLSTFEGILGNNLVNREPFKVEDMIRHNLDRNYLGWVLFKNMNLYVTTRDGNTMLSQAVTLASDDWNIHLDSINSSESVTIDKTIHLYTHRDAGIGKIIMLSKNRTLYLHGRLFLINGLEMKQGFIETTLSDTLIVYRSSVGTVLDPGNDISYVKGPLYIRFINMPASFFQNIIPLGVGPDFRPFYLSSTWPSGLTFIDIGFMSLSGKAPGVQLPSGITHISSVHYWQLTNPFNQSGFMINNVALTYDTLTNNDLVNDPANLRVIYKDPVNSFNLGGTGTADDKGAIFSTSGTPGFGLYTLGNALGGNNLLSANDPVAVITISGHCAKDSIILSAERSASDSAIINYEWNIQGPSLVLTPENSDTIKKSIDVPGAYTVTLIVTNNLGFSDTATMPLSIDPLPVVSYSVIRPCFPNPMEFTNTSTLPPSTTISSTEWKINASIFNSPNLNYTPTVSGLQTGYLKVTINNGCFDTTYLSEISPPKPQITLIPNGEKLICEGDSIVVKVNRSTGGTVVWNDGGNYDSLTIKTNAFKKATISITPQCFSSDSINVKTLSSPSVNAGPDFSVLPGKSVVIKGTSDGMVEWMPDTWISDAFILNPTSRPLATIQYKLRAYNTQGCEAFDSMTVFVNSDNTTSVPNLLTPNGDGHNDTWVLSNISDPENHKVYVFTREGQLVFSADSYTTAWDGKRDSYPLPDGYYVFVIENKNTGNDQTGILTILK